MSQVTRSTYYDVDDAKSALRSLNLKTWNPITPASTGDIMHGFSLCSRRSIIFKSIDGEGFLIKVDLHWRWDAAMD